MRPRPVRAVRPESSQTLSGAARTGNLPARRRPLPASAESPLVVHLVGVFVVDQSTTGGSWNGGVDGEVRVRRVRSSLRHFFEPFPPQADAPERGRRTRPTLPLLSQSLRLDAGTVHAPPHPRPQVSLFVVRQGVLAAVAASRTRAIPYGREDDRNPIQVRRFSYRWKDHPIRERSPLPALCVERRSPTVPTCELTFRHTPARRGFAARAASRPSLSSHT